MILKKTLKNGLIEVTSDSGMVDIGAGPVTAIIITKDELDYVSEVTQ